MNKPMTVKQLLKFCEEEIKNGRGDCSIMLSDDDEGNGNNIQEEIWKDIKGYEGLYQISNFDRVKSLNYNQTKSAKIMKPHSIKGGYLQIQLRYKERKNYLIHRLVAEAFIPNLDNLPEVNHKDENKLNNVVSNLEWCNSKYNANYGTKVVRQQEKMVNHSRLSKPVLCVETEIVYPSIREVERQTRNQG